MPRVRLSVFMHPLEVEPVPLKSTDRYPSRGNGREEKIISIHRLIGLWVIR